MTYGSIESIKIETEASYLHDGGWTAADHDLLIEEYGMTEKYATAICDELARIEEYEFKRYKEGSE